MSNEVKYEVVELTTGEAYPVTEVIFGGDEITMKFESERYGGIVTFDNRKQDGILKTEHLEAREIGTHLAADGHTPVEVTPEAPASEVVPATPVEGQVAEGAQTGVGQIAASPETVTPSSETTAPVAEGTEEEVTVA